MAAAVVHEHTDGWGGSSELPAPTHSAPDRRAGTLQDFQYKIAMVGFRGESQPVSRGVKRGREGEAAPPADAHPHKAAKGPSRGFFQHLEEVVGEDFPLHPRDAEGVQPYGTESQRRRRGVKRGRAEEGERWAARGGGAEALPRERMASKSPRVGAVPFDTVHGVPRESYAWDALLQDAVGCRRQPPSGCTATFPRGLPGALERAMWSTALEAVRGHRVEDAVEVVLCAGAAGQGYAEVHPSAQRLPQASWVAQSRWRVPRIVRRLLNAAAQCAITVEALLLCVGSTTHKHSRARKLLPLVALAQRAVLLTLSAGCPSVEGQPVPGAFAGRAEDVLRLTQETVLGAHDEVESNVGSGRDCDGAPAPLCTVLAEAASALSRARVDLPHVVSTLAAVRAVMHQPLAFHAPSPEALASKNLTHWAARLRGQLASSRVQVCECADVQGAPRALCSPSAGRVQSAVSAEKHLRAAVFAGHPCEALLWALRAVIRQDESLHLDSAAACSQCDGVVGCH